MFRFLAINILRFRWVVLVTFLGLTVFFGYHAKDVKLSYKLVQMLPQSDSNYVHYERFKKKFGEDGSIIIVGNKEKDFFRLNYFTKYQELASSIKAVHGVKTVSTPADIVCIIKNDSLRKFEVKKVLETTPQSQHELDSIKSKFMSYPFYENLLYNPEDNVYLMLITLTKEALNSKERMEVVQKIEALTRAFEAQQETEIHISGLPYLRALNMLKAKKELVLFTILAAAVTALILFIIFRSFYEVFFPVLIVLLGAVWAQGMLVLMGYEITILTGLMPPLLIVIGIPNSIYIINKYHQEFNKTNNKREALINVIEKTGNAIFLTNLTTAVGFATFIATSSAVLIEFGYVASINIMLLFAITLIIIPIVYSFLPNPTVKARKHLDNRLSIAITRIFVIISQQHRNAVYIIAFVIMGLSGYGITKIIVKGSIVDDLPKHDVVYQDLMFFEKYFGGVLPFEVSIDTHTPNGVVTSSKTWKRIDELQEFMQETGVFSRPLSYIELIKFANQAFYNGDPQHYELPSSFDKAFIVDYIQKDQSRDSMLRNFVDSTRQTARISVQMSNITTDQIEKVRGKIQEKVTELFPPENYTVHLTGASISYMEGSKYLVKNLIMSLALAIVIIAFFMSIMFKRLKIVVISLIPNMIPLLFTGGLMGYFGIPLKPSTVLVFSIAFGISVDDTIHFLAKLRQELKIHNGNMRSAVVIALQETGLSMAYTSIVLFFGFSVFTASDFGGTVALGTLVSITLFAAMFTNLVLLPAMLMTLHELTGRKQSITRNLKE